MVAERFLNFTIGSAPKCGTTSLHFILDQHPDIGLSEVEIQYFDANDPITHLDLFFYRRDDPIYYNNRPTNTVFPNRYAAHFVPFADLRLVGEYSMAYLFSTVVPRRIGALLSGVRLIFMLRDPVNRAYSQYWHMVKNGRSTCSFERTIHTYPAIVRGSICPPHLQRYQVLFGADHVKTVLLEDFVDDTQGTIDAVTDFLGALRMTISREASWSNKTYYPTMLAERLAFNWIGRYLVALCYSTHLGSQKSLRIRLGRRLHHLWFTRINPLFLNAERPPPMCEATRAYLQGHLSRRNDGLSEFLGWALAAIWPGFDD